MDSFSLDIRTLNFIIILFSCIYSIGLLCYQRSQKEIPGLQLFALSLLFIGIGPFFLGMRGTTPDWFSIVLANTIIMFGFQLVLHSLCIFRNCSLRYTYFTYTCIPITLSLFYYFTHVSPSIKARIIVISVFLAITTLLSAFTTLKGRHKDLKIAIWMMSTSFFLYGSFMTLRVAWTLYSEELHNFMYAELIHQLTFLFSIILVVAISFSMLWMINARLVNSIYDLSRRDPLTQLYNRYALERKLPDLINEINKVHPLSIIMVDIDNFKSINDLHGHLTGDEVIKRIAQIITAHTRNTDSAYRFGGDEILITLPKTDINLARAIAESLRKKISAYTLIEGNNLPMTSSFGVASLSEGEDWEHLVSRADQALYQAKQMGRNTVVTCSENPTLSAIYHASHHQHKAYEEAL
ncbi:GGDEF domain-containing protein [Photobacterium rosenbergii]|uniref:diguanylate cyclase n=1 Tax=Photobacterium rosenbergii TaxID=294936 RepID=A0ABU3ZIM5_9GAMM|nr:GGDEF domain-containing protein [Photobacterium rosenbergii]MDV5169979.1 GGDEF domain-containing protein [Photobacterium rosenbergii]